MRLRTAKLRSAARFNPGLKGGTRISDSYSLVEATMKIIQDRRSIREYTAEPVSDSDLDMILEAARQAPFYEGPSCQAQIFSTSLELLPRY